MRTAFVKAEKIPLETHTLCVCVCVRKYVIGMRFGVPIYLYYIYIHIDCTDVPENRKKEEKQKIVCDGFRLHTLF